MAANFNRPDIAIGVTRAGVMYVAQGPRAAELLVSAGCWDIEHGLYYSQLRHRTIGLMEGGDAWQTCTPSERDAGKAPTFYVRDLRAGEAIEVGRGTA